MIDLDDRISAHFTLREHVCKGCGGSCGNPQPAHPDLYPKLDRIREAIDEPLIVTSGYRCEAHNAKVGGAPRSRHLYGDAVDVKPASGRQDVLDEIVRQAVTLGFRGIKRYDRWVHLDLRPGDLWHRFGRMGEGSTEGVK